MFFAYRGNHGAAFSRGTTGAARLMASSEPPRTNQGGKRRMVCYGM